jgi:hypothetical protein
MAPEMGWASAGDPRIDLINRAVAAGASHNAGSTVANSPPAPPGAAGARWSIRRRSDPPTA